ncbi:MAG: pentapeptide repeat-containing protein, partial [Oscillospiraceae bacterium]
MKGCLAYDCFGAGQKTTQHFINNINWKQDTAKNHDIFQTFQIIFQLNQMQWYLLDAFLLISDNDLKTKIEDFIYENEKITNSGINEILNFNVEDYRFKINKILKQVCNTFSLYDYKNKQKNYLGYDFKNENIIGKDFSMALLINANFENCILHNVNFLGADIRDSNLKNADLSHSVFLTQMQINSAKGNL